LKSTPTTADPLAVETLTVAVFCVLPLRVSVNQSFSPSRPSLFLRIDEDCPGDPEAEILLIEKVAGRAPSKILPKVDAAEIIS
jgi:hypothetical protein